MKILVTGGCGFLGWNLCRALKKRHSECHIVALDNLWTGRRRDKECFDTFVNANVQTACAHLQRGYDYIYHLASPAAPIKYQSDPLLTIRSNVWGLDQCFQLLKGDGTLFFASSSEVYGDPLVSPQPESYKGSVSCTGPRACYDESKRLCETMCLEWGKWRYGSCVKIARLFNVYGPGTLPDDGRCVSNFVWQAMRGKTLTVYGDGKQRRCFTYVDDVVDAIIRLVEDTPAVFMGPINIGTNVETTVAQMSRAVIEEVGNWWFDTGRSVMPQNVEYISAVEDDPRQRLPELSLAKTWLDWEPTKLVPHGGRTGGLRRLINQFETEFLNAADYNDPGSSFRSKDPEVSA